jgi:hypothetical protein
MPVSATCSLGRLALGHRRLEVALPHLDLPLVREHHLAVLVASGRLHVDHAAVALLGRRLHAENGRLGLDRVADADRHPEPHVGVLEIRTPVLRDVLDALREDDVHHEARRRDEPPEAVGLRVAHVLRERVRREAEVGENREEPLGQGLPAAVAEDLPGTELLEEIAVFRRSFGHGRVA